MAAAAGGATAPFTKKIFASSVALIPPSETWDAIQAVRLGHDQQVNRWMPHINLLYPFFRPHEFADAAPLLARALASFPPFRITFAEFGVFSKKEECVAWLRPETDPPHALNDLMSALIAVFPACDDATRRQDGFHPHLTVGQFRNEVEANAFLSIARASWRPQLFQAREVCVIARAGDEAPFLVYHRIPFRGCSTPAPRVVAAAPDGPMVTVSLRGAADARTWDIVVPETWEQFLADIGTRIGARVVGIFTPEGGQLEALDEVLPGDRLVVDVAAREDAYPHLRLEDIVMPPGTASLIAGPERPSLVVDAVLQRVVAADGAPARDGTLDCRLRLPVLKQNPTLLLMVADRSGSMQHSWDQVQSALQYVFAASFRDPFVRAEAILYNSEATRLNCTEDNYIQVIHSQRATGKTCFASAFELCASVVEEYAERHAKEVEVVLGFMTDGQHTTLRKPLPCYQRLRDLLHALPCRTVVHCLGFTEEHRFEDLDRVRRELGNEEGGFQYAEVSDGGFALQRKLEAVFDVASSSGGKAEVELSLSPGYVSASGEAAWRVALPIGRDGEAAISAHIVPTSPEGWAAPLRVTARVLARNGVPIDPASCAWDAEASAAVVRREIHGETARTLEALQELSRELNHLFETVMQRATEVSNKKKAAGKAADAGVADDVSEGERDSWAAALRAIQDRLQQEFAREKLFKLAKDGRSVVFDLIQAMTDRVQQLHSILGQWARGAWSTAHKARLAEITYGGVFYKARRRRIMDERVQRNAKTARKGEAALHALVPRAPSDVTDDSASIFQCVLSLLNWAELTEEKDVMGFGCAVGRPEWVVDDATALRVFGVSNTFVAKSAMEDAISHSINIQGHVRTHGGFGLGGDTAVAIRGSSREPINAWLPLYLTAHHWEAARVQLKQILGYFVTLDPLGYGADQVDALFLVLGTMLCRMDHPPGERSLVLLSAFLRSCWQVAKEYHLVQRMAIALKAFVDSPQGRRKDAVPSVLVLVGSLAVLPPEMLDGVLPSAAHWRAFWTRFAEQSVRRAAGAVLTH